MVNSFCFARYISLLVISPWFFLHTLLFAAPYVLVIDPGHGGKDPGASSANGKYFEKTLCLEFARDLQHALKAYPDVVVHMTRDKDKTVSLRKREQFIREHAPDLLLSLHMDAGDKPVYRGFTLFTQSVKSLHTTLRDAAVAEQELQLPASILANDGLARPSLNLLGELSMRKSKQLGDTLIQELLPQDHWHSKRVVFRDLYVLHQAVPNLLLEMGFISNQQDLKRMLDPSSRQAIANRFAKIVHSFLLTL